MSYRALTSIALTLAIAATLSAADGASMTPTTDQLLRAGDEPVRIVCFGDSITGVYYHTGGLRAYSEMLQIALDKLYPDAEVKVFNAGISGHTTVNALARIQKDVLDRKPHLVTVMFGMNDVTRVPEADYRNNLVSIVQQCRGVGAEVALCTPNSVYREDANRAIDKLARYAQIVRDVATEMNAPLIDYFAIWEDLYANDRLRFMLLMSETIHPGMHGHRLFAEEIAKTISGKSISLADVKPPWPALKRTLALLAAGKPVKVIAMPPYDEWITSALKQLAPEAQAEVTSWPVEGQSVAQIEAWSKAIREKRPNLVIIAVPADAAYTSQEQFIRSYCWVLNWALSFGIAEWDCIGVLPSVAKPDLNEAERANEQLAEKLIDGQHIWAISRKDQPEADARELFEKWIASQAGEQPK